MALNRVFGKCCFGSAPQIYLEMQNNALVGAPKPSKGYWQGLTDCAITQGFVVYPGDDCYPLAQGSVPVNVCGLRHIAKITDGG